MDYKFRYWSNTDQVMLDRTCLMQTAFNTRNVAEQHAATTSFEPLIYRVLGAEGRHNGVLMLWTGLRDRRDTPIFEADIVRATSAGTRTELEVRWGDARAGFFLHREAGALVWNLAGGGPDGRVETCEVIGNRYENPELLAGLQGPAQ